MGEFIHSEKLSCRYLKIQPLTLLHVIVSVIFFKEDIHHCLLNLKLSSIDFLEQWMVQEPI